MPSSKTLLLVEDNSRIREKLESLIKPYVAQVIAVSSGAEALSAYNSYRPHVIILEQFLGDISGEELLWRWRRELSVEELPILMMTSSRFGQLLSTTRNQLNAVLTKPLQSKVLLQQILQILQKIEHLPPPPPLMQCRQATSLALFQGDLSKKPFPHLLMDFQRKNLTGILSLSVAEGERRIALSGGQIVYAESFIPSEEFPTLLQKHFSRLFELKSIEQFFVGSGGRAILQHEVVSKMGLIPHQDLEAAFQHYIREITIRCFFLLKGSYSFVDDLAYVKRVAQAPFEFLALLFEGIRRYYSIHELSQEFAAVAQQPLQLAPDYQERIGMMIRLFPQISFAPHRFEQRTVQEVLSSLTPNPELSVQLLKTLLISKLLLLVSSPTEKSLKEQEYRNGFNSFTPLKNFTFSHHSLPAFQLNESAPFSSGHYSAVPPGKTHDWLDSNIPSDRYTQSNQRIFPSMRQTQENPITHEAFSSPSLSEFTEDAFEGTGPTLRITSEMPIVAGNAPQRQYQTRVTREQASLSSLPSFRSSSMKPPSRMPPNPNLAKKYHSQGQHCLKSFNYADAINYFQKAAELESQNPHHWLFLGWAVFRSAKGDAARVLQGKQYVQQAIKLRTDFKKAYYFLGLIHKEQGEWDEAESLFKYLQSLDPHNKDILKHLQDIATKKSMR